MKHKTLPALVFLLSLGLAARAQVYSINWHTIDGGGGTSTGGVYSVSGTIGQPDAGVPMAGGNYSLVGGFWGVVSALQTPGAPLLSVQRIGGSVRVFWPWPATDFVLDQTAALTSPPAAIGWAQVPLAAYQTNATHISITIPTSTGSKFYRLRRP